MNVTLVLTKRTPTICGTCANVNQSCDLPEDIFSLYLAFENHIGGRILNNAPGCLNDKDIRCAASED
jgi:hypothetical protein